MEAKQLISDQVPEGATNKDTLILNSDGTVEFMKEIDVPLDYRLPIGAAGRLRGIVAAKKNGVALYRGVNKEGNDGVVREHKRGAGKVGGATFAERYGKDAYKEMGRRGYAVLIQKYGPDFFSILGKLGHNAARKARERREAERLADLVEQEYLIRETQKGNLREES